RPRGGGGVVRRGLGHRRDPAGARSGHRPLAVQAEEVTRPPEGARRSRAPRRQGFAPLQAAGALGLGGLRPRAPRSDVERQFPDPPSPAAPRAGQSRSDAERRLDPAGDQRGCAGAAAPPRIASRFVRALRISDLNGPEALELNDVREPEATHMLTPGEGAIVEVKAAAISFPDVLQSRGLYQFKPDLPFVP